MKIRSVNHLQDLIDKETSWRKVEFSSLMSSVRIAKFKSHNTALRAGVALLYAHWEGAVKSIATYYLVYVSNQKIYYKDLKNNFLAIGIRDNLSKFEATNKSSIHNRIVDNVFKIKADERFSINVDGFIKSGSNLNSEIFVEIMEQIGLDYTEYEADFKLIDEVLLKTRNKIAHGEALEALSLDEDRFNELHRIVLKLIQLFANQVLNSACQKSYLQSDSE